MIARRWLVWVCIAILVSTGTGLPHICINSTPREMKQNQTTSSPDVLAFYYPWYGTPSVSGQWMHWDGAGHNPDNIVEGRRDISAAHYPLIDVYDCTDKSTLQTHIQMAKAARIDGFVASWWGIGSFEDIAVSHLRTVCEAENFQFTIYYETTSSVATAVADLEYLLNTYAGSPSWYRLDGRPVIYVYARAREQLAPSLSSPEWEVYGAASFWVLVEWNRELPRSGVVVFHPYPEGSGYVQSNWIPLPIGGTYTLKAGISNFQNDCDPHSDVAFNIKVRSQGESWEYLDYMVVNFNQGWLDLSYDISSRAGDAVMIRVESFPGGVYPMCSEWSAVDYLFIEDSQGNILNPVPYFNNQWKTVVSLLRQQGYNPYIIMDYAGYTDDPGPFLDHFQDDIGGIHVYTPFCMGANVSRIAEVYLNGSAAASERNKRFVATVAPGYDDSAINTPAFIVDRQEGAFYESLWEAAKSCTPGGYIICSFNEWHEGTEIEPSLEFEYQYIQLTSLLRGDVGLNLLLLLIQSLPLIATVIGIAVALSVGILIYRKKRSE
ncbi:MAG: hypothetical protein ACFFCO_06655 [Promethearchaeota archaeon]